MKPMMIYGAVAGGIATGQLIGAGLGGDGLASSENNSEKK